MRSALNILFLTILLAMPVGIFSQDVIQICDSCVDPDSCISNLTPPDYNSVDFDYIIHRDHFVYNAPRLGKLPNDPSPWSKINLQLDVYTPYNNEDNRPVVLVPRGSGYDSPIGKSKLLDDEGYRYLLSSLAKKGFVVITYEYRTMTRVVEEGFYVDLSPNASNGNTLDSCAYHAFLSNPSVLENQYYRCNSCMVLAGKEDEADTFYRWMMYFNRQDALAAVGYALKDPKNLGLNIDLNKVFIGGISNGGQVAITSAYLDGADFENDPVGNLIANNFGPMDTLGYAPLLPNDFEFAAVFSLWGSIHDLSWIDSNDPPAFLVHGSWDEVIPYQSNYIGHGDHSDTSKFYTHGSERMMCELISKNIDAVLWSVYHGNHGYYIQTDECTPATVCGFLPSEVLNTKILQFLRAKVLFNSTSTIVHGTNLENIPCPDLTHNFAFDYLEIIDSTGVCVSSPDHLAWNINALNEFCACNNSQVPASVIPISDLGYSTKHGADKKVIELYPNPFDDNIIIRTENISNDISMHSLKGERCSVNVVGSTWNSITLETSSLAPGVYILKIGGVSRKIVKIDQAFR
ncbi:MAG: T9SS type A sorting domain-containing protein [Flavobacteriales bacterium]|nr:T9SS type A sorting domain-containing protein [Flavobacteriales bacterium]